MTGRVFDMVEVDENEALTANDTAYDDKFRAFDAAMHAVGNEAIVEVWRIKNTSINPNSPEGRSSLNTEFCDQYPVDMFDFAALNSHIKNTYGAGTFRIYLKEKGKIKNNTLLTVAAPKQNNVPVARPGAGAGEFTQLFAIMMENQQRQDERFAALLEAMKTPQQDPRAEMMASLTMLKEMKSVMGEAPPPPAPVDPFATLFATLNNANKLRELLGGNIAGAVESETADDSVMGVIKEVAPGFIELWKREQDLRAADKTLAAGQIVPRTLNPAPRQASPVLPEAAVKLFTTLQAQAANDDDPESIGAYLVTIEAVRENLRPMVNDAKPFARLLEIWPDAVEYPMWWGELIEVVREKLIEFDAQNQTGQTAGNSVPVSPPNVNTDNTTSDT